MEPYSQVSVCGNNNVPYPGFCFWPGRRIPLQRTWRCPGYLVSRWLNAFIGKPGTGIIIALMTITYFIFALNVPLSSFGLKLPAFLSFLKQGKAEQDIFFTIRS